MNDTAKIGIVTVVLNAEKTIENTIKSVKDQNYKNIIHLIIDGGSNDNTHNVILLNEHEKMDFQIRPGLGLYESMNYGIKLLMNKVDLIGFLNADDFLCNQNVLGYIVQRHSFSDILMSAVNIVDIDNLNNSLRTFNPVGNKFLQSMCILSPHPGFYVSTTILKKISNPYYDPKAGPGADIVWMMKLLKNTKKTESINIISVCMRDGGISNDGIISKVSLHIKLYKYVYGNFWLIFVPFIFIIKLNRLIIQKRRSYKLNH